MHIKTTMGEYVITIRMGAISKFDSTEFNEDSGKEKLATSVRSIVWHTCSDEQSGNTE